MKNTKSHLKKSQKAEQLDDHVDQKLKRLMGDEFMRFIEYHPAKRLSLNLRKMLLEFLQFDGSIEASYLQDLLYDLDGLFDLLELVQSEGNQK